MKNGYLPARVGKIAIVAAILAATVYFVMVSVTLAHLEVISGQRPFDMRPFGYSPSDAATFLEALGIDGREYYLSHQIPLDMLYPVLLAMTLSNTILWFGSRMPNRRLMHLGAFLAVGSGLFDYIENLGIVAIILSWPDLADYVVYATSAATILKSVTTTLAVSLAVLTGLLWSRWAKAGDCA
ncbi:MAG: hypothetical protein ABJN39_04495 [Sulfitobacter sp.]|uniref:hypothetical protein n=1 Tax=Alphaproteobacteria TaxID=28211 RepID=UPI002943B6D6|nr:hypothetical protein [Sulfitobacter sp. LC.270.F.C4]WOI15260.1 hypothetical protein R1T45_19645 [Sulfitobacter sp. LC.270.F.C4]